ncbi:MAG: hypothetical protein K8S27_00920 [Candidatus Omnitrophica bacterium]|nr:hypothetical protein [Candidatus Omnitrophota bacterium]
MKKEIELEKIEFKKTSDPLQSAGLIGLYKYCEKRKSGNEGFNFYLEDNSLIIKSRNLKEELFEIYSAMGAEYYDTNGKKQLEKNEGFYYDDKKDAFIRFPKVKTTGVANLIQRGAQPTPLGFAKTLSKKKKPDGKSIEEEKFVLYNKIIQYCKDEKIKFGKKVWFNGRNTVVPELEKLDICKGKHPCMICGETFKKTYESKSFSPFIGGSNSDKNFVSMMKGSEKVCWKCLYVQRFSPVTFFYQTDFKTMNAFYFDSSTLEGLKRINIELLKPIFYTKDQKVSCNFARNFRIFQFGQDKARDYFDHFSEVFLMLLYTVNKQLQFVKFEIEEDDFLQLEQELVYRTDVFYFQTSKFASTMRPKLARTFSDFQYVFVLFKKVDEKFQEKFEHLLWNLKLSKKEQNDKTDLTLFRNKWAEAVLKRKSTLSIIEQIIVTNFMNKKFFGDFSLLLEWLVMYESLTNYGGNRNMNGELREVAINFGKQIVGSARGEQNKNTLKGKLIKLRKSRTLTNFLDQIISIQARYELSINNDILTKLNDSNFVCFRQFTIISALNAFNAGKKSSTQNKQED